MKSVCLSALVGLVPLTGMATPLSLEAALVRASTAAPEVQLASRVLGEAEASIIGAGVPLPENPRLFIDYRRLASPPPIDPLNGYNVGVDGKLEVSGAGFARIEEAERRVSLARSELVTAQTVARMRAWVAYVTVQVGKQRVGMLEEALVIANRVENASRERQRNGVVGEPDVVAATLESANVRLELDEAKSQVLAASDSLRQVLDLAADERIELEQALPDPRPPEDEASLVQRALDQRPELSLVRARLALLEATDSRLFREGALPKLTYNLGFDAAPASPVFGYAGIGVELPVAQRNQGPRAITQAQQATERVRLETELRRVRREVVTARRSYEVRLRQLALLTKESLPAAERNEDLVEEGWKAGRFDIFRLTVATRELNRVRRQRLETLLAAWSDYVELLRASGGLNP